MRGALRSFFVAFALVSSAACAADPEAPSETSATASSAIAAQSHDGQSGKSVVGTWRYSGLNGRTSELALHADSSFTMKQRGGKHDLDWAGNYCVREGVLTIDITAGPDQDPAGTTIRGPFALEHDTIVFQASIKHGHHGTIFGTYENPIAQDLCADDATCFDLRQTWDVREDGTATVTMAHKSASSEPLNGTGKFEALGHRRFAFTRAGLDAVAEPEVVEIVGDALGFAFHQVD
jgi:hypothetical protein